jgi:hypothetical protein
MYEKILWNDDEILALPRALPVKYDGRQDQLL